MGSSKSGEAARTLEVLEPQPDPCTSVFDRSLNFYLNFYSLSHTAASTLIGHHVCTHHNRWPLGCFGGTSNPVVVSSCEVVILLFSAVTRLPPMFLAWAGSKFCRFSAMVRVSSGSVGGVGTTSYQALRTFVLQRISLPSPRHRGRGRRERAPFGDADRPLKHSRRPALV